MGVSPVIAFIIRLGGVPGFVEHDDALQGFALALVGGLGVLLHPFVRLAQQRLGLAEFFNPNRDRERAVLSLPGRRVSRSRRWAASCPQRVGRRSDS